MLRVTPFIRFALVVLCVLTFATAARAVGDRCADPPKELGKFETVGAGGTLPTAKYLDENGNEQSLDHFRGKPLLVNFWATWCAPCVKEMPALNQLAGNDAAKIQVLTLSADREGAPVVKEFFQVNGIHNLPVAMDKLSRVAREVKAEGLPTTILYNAQGREVGRVVGAAEWDSASVVAFLEGCLAS